MWDLEASLSTCVPYSYKKKRQLSIAAGNVTLPSLLNLRSHSSAPASCKFFAVEPYSTCSYLVTSLVCSFFYFIEFFVHTRCVVSCWTEELSGNGQRSILYRRTRSYISAIHAFEIYCLQAHVPSSGRSETRSLAPKTSSRPTPRSCERLTL